jgi:hypothetical protein
MIVLFCVRRVCALRGAYGACIIAISGGDRYRKKQMLSAICALNLHLSHSNLPFPEHLPQQSQR